jgi:serine protease
MKPLFIKLNVFLLLIFLAACSNPSGSGGPTAGTLSGILLAPFQGDVQDSILLGCFIQSNTCNVNSDNTQIIQVNASGSSAAFQFRNLAEGSYAIFAFKDTNEDGDFRDIVDYQGCYGSNGQCVAVNPPTEGLNVQLQTEKPPVVPGSISGTLFMPGQVNGSSDLRTVTQPDFSNRPSDFRIGEVIVKFKSNGISTLAEREPLASYQFAGQRLERIRLLGIKETALYKSNLNREETLALVNDLNQRSDVEYAQPNYIKYALKVPNDEFYGVQWHYPAMNLEAAWDIEDGTTNPVTVAVVDTGLLAHPDLEGVNIGGYDFVSPLEISGDGDGRDADPTDVGGESGYHGGHVAGTVAARTNNGDGLAGVSWGAKVVPVRVLGIGGGTIADIIDGTLWAGGESVTGAPSNPNPAKVINMSLGGEGPCSALEEEAFATLKAKGVVVVVAAGNSNDDAGFFSPANCDDVITVGATGPTGERAPYSNYGSKIDVMATGGDTSKTIDFQGSPYQAGVWSTLKDDFSGDFFYGSYQGTSMAAPHIAGIVALMLSKEPTLTPDQVLARLIDSAKPLSAGLCLRPSGDDCGAGLVDAAAALGSSDGGTPPPPPTEDIKTYIAALYCADFFCSTYDDNLSGIIDISDNRQQFPYQITQLFDGAYVVAGWQDINNDIEIQDEEPFGFYDPNNDNLIDFDDLVFIENNVGKGNIDIYLKLWTTTATSNMAKLKSNFQTNIKHFMQQQRISLPSSEALEQLLKK